jgi:hypothetical protein
MSCDDTGTGDPSSIILKANRSSSGRGLNLGTDNANIDALFFANLTGRAFKWSGTGQTFNEPDGGIASEPDSVLTAFYKGGGSLFSTSEATSAAINDLAIPDTVDMIIFDMKLPTVFIEGESYGQMNAVPWDRNMQIELEDIDHQATMRIVESDGTVRLIGTKDSTTLNDFFYMNYIVFLNPAVLDGFTSPISGKIVYDGSDSVIQELDGTAMNAAVQNLVPQFTKYLSLEGGYITILPMSPVTPWDDGMVTITLSSNFDSLLSAVWTVDNSDGDDTSEIASFLNVDHFEAPILEWGTYGLTTASQIDSVVDFEADADGMAIDWSITVE